MSTKKEKETTQKYVSGYSPKDIETRVVKSFLDILLLIEMKKQSNLSGYDLTAFVNNKFGGILSPGTVYATIYTLERKGLIKGESDGRKTVYQLTPQGTEVITEMMKEFNQQMTIFVKKFLML
ncbi:MAG: PadR family transcriptional regulator [Candidatus Bathyarchaeota archaeon]|nr:PadR family transcriptional regulator [Candidatus Bathyarchaeota archaeon]